MPKHRWTWPKEAAVPLSTWLTQGQLVRRTGKHNAIAGKRYGKIVEISTDTSAPRRVVIERRDATTDEPGKYRYRLLDFDALMQYYDAIDYSVYSIHEPRVGLSTFIKRPPGTLLPALCVYKNGKNDVVPWLGAYDLTWDHGSSRWELLDDHLFDALCHELLTFYGLDQEARSFTLRVHIDAALINLVSTQEATLFERCAIRRSQRWDELFTGHKVTMLNPQDPEHCALIIRDVPAQVYRMHLTTLGDHILDVQTCDVSNKPERDELTDYKEHPRCQALYTRARALYAAMKNDE